jgi:O-succinylhomoserine sulfhydrylase
MPKPDPDWQQDTLAVRAGTTRSQFGEHSEALYLTSSFVFENAAQAAARFCGEAPGDVYARFTNPTVTMLQERLAALEGGERCVATASGMSAIHAVLMALLKAGDHIVSAQSIFGATQNLFSSVMSRFGLATTFVASTKVEDFAAAITPATRLIYIETPANPLTEIFDIAALAQLAKARGVLLVVDNCFCTPVLQRPLDWGADLVIHSATKYLDGQGRVLGGAVVGRHDLLEEIFKYLRTAGPCLSPFNAWVILKGCETLKLRMFAQSAAALALAQWLETQPQVERVYYPGLASHAQHSLAARQMRAGGAIVSFEVKGSRAEAWRVVDAARLLSITANLGDTRSTITHPATTTHGRISAESRAKAGIHENLLRVAVGLEDLADIQADLARGLSLL